MINDTVMNNEHKAQPSKFKLAPMYRTVVNTLTNKNHCYQAIYSHIKRKKVLCNFLQEYTGHNGSIKGSKFLGNDNYFISTGEDKLMKMWDRRAKKELKHQPFDQAINST